jgi:hypothetical protein
MSNNASKRTYNAPVDNATNATIDLIDTKDLAWIAAVDIVTHIEKGITMEGESHPVVSQMNFGGANSPAIIDLKADDSNVSTAAWKNISIDDVFLKIKTPKIEDKTLDTRTKNRAMKETPNLLSSAGKETVPDPKDYSIVMTDKRDASASPPVTNNPAGNGNENEEPNTIATTTKGNASALPTLTSILTCNIFQTAGQLLKATTEANLIFNEGGVITITNGEDPVLTLTTG